MAEFFDGIKELFGAQPSTAPEPQSHPSEEILLSYLRGDLAFKIRRPQEVLEEIRKGNLKEWFAPDVGAHIGICKICKAKALELQEVAEAQPWWELASAIALSFVEKRYSAKLSNFKDRLHLVREMPAKMIEDWAWSGPPSPIGAWALGQEESNEDKEGIAVLSAASQALSELWEPVSKEFVLTDTVKQMFVKKLKAKSVPKEVTRQFNLFLKEMREKYDLA